MPPGGQVDVRIFIADEVRGVGALKHYACRQAHGEILLELDHDDVLASDALEEVQYAFDEFPEVGFVYSDCAQIREDGSADTTTFDLGHGWEYRHDVVDGREVFPFASMEPTPANMSYIWYAPNHLRAFRRSVYEQAGGYDISLEVLDDQDLVSRLFQVTEFRHIPETLYLQRVGVGNTQALPETNALIQTRSVELHDKYLEPMALAWAKRKGLLALDLGGAWGSPGGYLTVDQAEPADYVGDIFDVLGKMEDSSAGVVRAVDFLEHIPDKVGIANEIHRVLAPDGIFLACTPSALGQGGFMDPTHCAFYTEASFWYLCNRDYQKYVPALTARFQESRLVTFFPTPWHEEQNIPYIRFDGICLKPGGVRNGGYNLWS